MSILQRGMQVLWSALSEDLWHINVHHDHVKSQTHIYSYHQYNARHFCKACHWTRSHFWFHREVPLKGKYSYIVFMLSIKPLIILFLYKTTNGPETISVLKKILTIMKIDERCRNGTGLTLSPIISINKHQNRKKDNQARNRRRKKITQEYKGIRLWRLKTM